jgi:hypothetical protein
MLGGIREPYFICKKIQQLNTAWFIKQIGDELTEYNNQSPEFQTPYQELISDEY